MWSWTEASNRYVESIRQSSPVVALVALGVMATFVALGSTSSSWKHHKRISQAGLVVCLVLAAAWSWHLRWISDDTFITLRYAKNWITGHGLVFNLGERVEGYTNFLWLAVLAFLQLLGIDGPAASVYLGIVCLLLTIVTVHQLVRTADSEEARVLGSSSPAIRASGLTIVACVMLAGNYAFASFGTGGLETMFAAMLVTLALERAYRGSYLTAGVAGIAGTMAHPDHALFYIALSAAILIDRTRRKHLVRFFVPFVCIYLPYTILRWRYFGDFFPNTYYAKAAHLSYFSQGGFYLGTSFLSSGAWAALPLFVYSAVVHHRNFVVRYALIALPLYLLYVAKVGGDYMMGRLICPILPVLFVVAELGLLRILRTKPAYLALAGSAFLLPTVLCTPIVGPGEVKWYLTDERTMYKLVSLRPMQLAGGTPLRVKRLKEYLADQGLRFSYGAFAIGLVGWETNWPIVDLHGLTDRKLAREPLPRRGRPGHERMATPAHIIERGADLAGMPVFPDPYAELTKLEIEGEGFFLTHYNAALTAKHHSSGAVRFVNFPAYLDGYIAKMHTMQPAQIREDMTFFDSFYFRHVDDADRRRQLAAYVGG